MNVHLDREEHSEGNKRNSKDISLRDISLYIEKMYDVEVSASVLSEITDRVIPQVKSE